MFVTERDRDREQTRMSMERVGIFPDSDYEQFQNEASELTSGIETEVMLGILLASFCSGK